MSTEVQPLSRPALEAVPGVLGAIALERLADYSGTVVGPAGAVEGAGAFEDALRAPGLSVIAEVKRASPSQGHIRDLDPVATAREYETGGAAAISVLTEPRRFGGELAHLQDVTRTVSVPVLRKDFTVHPAQVAEASAAGASAVLLIVALTLQHTRAWIELAARFGLAALVEVHDEDELGIALDAGARVIGVNNRDLRTLRIDLETAPKLCGRARAAGFTGVLVAESGYSTAAELRALPDGIDAVLIGTSLTGSGSPGAALKDILTGR